MLQDIKYNPGATLILGRCAREGVHMLVLQVKAVQNETGLRKWAQKTQTYTEHPIRYLYGPADATGHQMQPRCNSRSWQMCNEGVHMLVPLVKAVQNETGPRKWAQKKQTITEIPICYPYRPADAPGHQIQPGHNFNSWQMCKGGVHMLVLQVKAVQNETGLTKLAQRTQTNTELPIHYPYRPADNPGHRIDPRQNSRSKHLCKKGRALAFAASNGCAKRTSLIKWAQKTQTNTELPIRYPYRPADATGHHIQPRRNSNS